MNAFFNKLPGHRLFRPLVLFMLPLGISLAATAADQPATASSQGQQQSSSWKSEYSPLIYKVRKATSRFRDLKVALYEGWGPGTPCVSGPNTGAMGVHFLVLDPRKPDRLHDGVLNVNQPEALIYEPQSNGGMRLVGVEYIVIASEWATKHPEGGPAVLEGHLTNYVDEPNRYGLPAFYELHVWAWEDNPKGSFADWNTRVTCEKQESPVS
jgi:hypothetical protein